MEIMSRSISGAPSAMRSFWPAGSGSRIYSLTSLRPPQGFARLAFSTQSFAQLPAGIVPGVSGSSGSSHTYFQRSPLPANTIIRFVPQQTAWVVERMGKFRKILEPGLAVLVPFLDRIAYVQSLKESAQEIPSQKAITADNVTLELDGVLYTRVFDAFKARQVVPSLKRLRILPT